MNTRLLLAFLGFTTIAATAEDWPAYRGPRGDGISKETVPDKLPANGPKLLWKAPTTAGLSSFSVAAGKVFTTILRTNDGKKEVCIALDAANGKELWGTETGPVKYSGGADSGAEGNRGGDGPRSTPTISDGKVYVFSAEMVLVCMEATSGKVAWSKDIKQEYSGKNIGWNSALSPVVRGDLVYVAGGGEGQAMLAFNKRTGELAWKTGSGGMTHATPVATELHGVPQVLFMMQPGVIAVQADSGKELWRFAHPYRTATACSPVIGGDTVFVTASYEVGGAAARVTKSGDAFEATEIWRDKGNSGTSSLWSTPVYHGGYLYGMISGKKYGTGPLKCVDMKDASVKWQQPGFGAGQVILAGDIVIALADDGHVSLVKANPNAYEEKARFKAVEGKCWSTPALSNGRLYVRSTKEGACYDLTAK